MSLPQKSASGLIAIAIFTLALLVLKKFSGNAFSYIFFTIVFNAILINSFLPNRAFFDLYTGIFLWLGFWMKMSVGYVFDLKIAPIGTFDFSPQAWDAALTVSALGGAGFLLASLVRRKFLVMRPFSESNYGYIKLTHIYAHYRIWLWIVFLLAAFYVAFLNGYFNFFQRGRSASIELPFIVSGTLRWLLMFGFSAIGAVLLQLEINLGKKPYIMSALALVEVFMSNVSMLSRAFIVNGSAAAYGAYSTIRAKQGKVSFSRMTALCAFFGVLLVLSVLAVNFLRSEHYSHADGTLRPSETSASAAVDATLQVSAGLFFDRWLGIEGVMAVSAYKNLGWPLWREAWSENYDGYGTSFYDRTIIPNDSPYRILDMTKHHFVTLPGLLAVLYYPGSYMFLFLMAFLIALLAGALEFAAFKFSGQNLIFCSIIGMVLAFRFTNFGYVPAQSYLLLGTIVLNIALLHCFRRWNA